MFIVAMTTSLFAEVDISALLVPLRLLMCSLAVLVRLGVGLYPYSGAGEGPLFGDYEAQRHWMEITKHLPIHDWYVNTTQNDLLYWGLDYPPLTAYHSWLCGQVSHWIQPDWVALGNSRGYESYNHKLFMRISVILADLTIFFPSVILFSHYHLKDLSKQIIMESLMLLQPALLLIDHGHFQYNCVSLGLFVMAVLLVTSNCDSVGSVLFCLSLNYKQMELYHALPFFFYLLGKSLKKSTWRSVVAHLVRLAAAVIGTFLICWAPFLTKTDVALQVLHRLFPFARGIFEDKVANIWCTLSILIKFRSLMTTQAMLRMSLMTTLLCMLPSSIHLLIRPTTRNFLLALVNSSLIFFLFSFQVHEKSILLVVIPLMLLMTDYPLSCSWFSVVAVLSMYPLLDKDGVTVALWSATFLQSLIAFIAFRHLITIRETFLVAVSILPLTVMCLVSHFVRPPSRYPDLYPVLISALSSFTFFCFCVFTHLQEFIT